MEQRTFLDLDLVDFQPQWNNQYRGTVEIEISLDTLKVESETSWG